MVLGQSYLQIDKTRLAIHINVWQRKDIFINSHSCKYCTVNLTAVLRLFMRSDQGAKRMKRARSSASPAAAVLVECVELTPGHTKLVSIIG